MWRLTAQPPPLTPEDRILLKRQARKDIESDLSGKAQELLNRFYPMNSIIAKVKAEFMPAKDAALRAKELRIKKLKTIVLVDNRLNLTAKIKQATFTTVAAAIGYDKKRGDKIIIQKVPFHLATPFSETVEATAQKPVLALSLGKIKKYSLWGAAVLGIVVIIWLLNLFFRRRPARTIEAASPNAPAPAALARERLSAVDQIKSIADNNPEKIAEMLKKWLSE